MSTDSTLLTVEQYLLTDDSPYPTELVRGKIVTLTFPGFQHGCVCSRISQLLGNCVEDRDLGHVLRRTGVITTRNPDSVRGADVSFYSYSRLPKGKAPAGYAPLPPDLVFEVLSADDRWPDVLAKVAEYLKVGVLTVCVVDPETETVTVYAPNKPPLALSSTEELRLPAPLAGFAVPVKKLFE
ncbi:MAG: Uma2 family endonuclease [Planctomycetia bacterium]|nr:Uma2 family endonuclease [Planctomycetia bacterium]